MKFEDLKLFFKDEVTIKVIVSAKVDATFVKFSSIENQRVSFYNIDANESSQTMYGGRISENDENRLKVYIDNKKHYFAKVVDSTKEYVLISIISFEKYFGASEMNVGIKDIKNYSFNEISTDIESNFLITIGSTKYYIRGRHYSGNDNVFSICNAYGLYDVKLVSRFECSDGAIDHSKMHDQIFAISKKSHDYNKDDYSFNLSPYKITLSDITSTKAATLENAIEMSSQASDSIFNRWKKFAEEDFDYEAEKIQKAGTFTCTHHRIEDGLHVFEIVRDLDRYDYWHKNIINLGNAVVLEYNYESEFHGKTRQESHQFRLVRMSGNEITCVCEREINPKCTPGIMSISLLGAQFIYDRRKSALDRIYNGKSAKPNIMQLIEGKSLSTSRYEKKYRIDDFSKEISRAFKGTSPNAAQRMAIEIAINTPDFAIVQGPPGCGKTSLINAIDNCLAKIDSTFHKRGAILSTAYQRESTRNMIEKKRIYGLPVPFLSRDSESSEIEKQFYDFFNEISGNLCTKYPELLKNVNKQTHSSVLKNIIINFDEENARYDVLISFIESIQNEIGTYGDLFDVYNIAKQEYEKMLKPFNSKLLYYAGIIPTKKESIEDGGIHTFRMAKMNLLLECPGLENQLSNIEKLYSVEPVDYKALLVAKIELLYSIQNIKRIDKNIDLNRKAIKIANEILEQYKCDDLKNTNHILTKYINYFLNEPVAVRQAIDEWVTSIAATHQISSDNKVVGQLGEDGTISSDVVYCDALIDEAARSCPPDLFIPISCTQNRIVMVGDHRQLPQFVNDEVLDRLNFDNEVKNEMKNISMFQHLIESTKKLEKNDGFKRFVALDSQYRMPKILGDFISDNFYSGDVKIQSPRGNPCDDNGFVQTMPYIENECMVWCDVPYGKEKFNSGSGSKSNPEEAKVVAKLVARFLHDENNKKLSIGVISFYKSQVYEIMERLTNDFVCVKNDNGVSIASEFEKRLKIDTVDAFQGLECDIVILSMVRSDPYNKFKRNSFGFLRDERHLCVALSRQKRCLIVVGNGSGMLETDVANSAVKPLVNFYKKCKEGGEYVKFIDSKNID